MRASEDDREDRRGKKLPTSFPTSPKPLFRTFGILAALLISMCLFLAFRDQGEEQTVRDEPSEKPALVDDEGEPIPEPESDPEMVNMLNETN